MEIAEAGKSQGRCSDFHAGAGALLVTHDGLLPIRGLGDTIFKGERVLKHMLAEYPQVCHPKVSRHWSEGDQRPVKTSKAEHCWFRHYLV